MRQNTVGIQQHLLATKTVVFPEHSLPQFSKPQGTPNVFLTLFARNNSRKRTARISDRCLPHGHLPFLHSVSQLCCSFPHHQPQPQSPVSDTPSVSTYQLISHHHARIFHSFASRRGIHVHCGILALPSYFLHLITLDALQFQFLQSSLETFQFCLQPFSFYFQI